MNESLLLLIYQVKMVSSLWEATKNQLTAKYERKFSVFNISHNKFIIYIRKFTTVNNLGYISYKEIQMTTGMYKVPIKSLAKHK